MAVRILIPTPLRAFTGQQAEIRLDGHNVGELLENLVARYGELRQHLFTPDGKLRSFVNIYVNDNDIRYLEKERTPIGETDTLSIIPSVAGGAPGSPTTAPEPRTTTPVDSLPTLSNDEVRRYSRHLIMPEVGVEGQRRLKAAKVLCVGAGGLGSPASLYLAAAGVGTLGLVDFDTVDFSNLQRQVLYDTADVGRSKLGAAKARLTGLNPDVNVVTHETALKSSNALEILGQYRRDRRRRRQLPHQVSRERCLRAARQAERVRQHLPVRRAGVGVRGQGWAVLSLPVPGAAAAGTRAELR